MSARRDKLLVKGKPLSTVLEHATFAAKAYRLAANEEPYVGWKQERCTPWLGCRKCMRVCKGFLLAELIAIPRRVPFAERK